MLRIAAVLTMSLAAVGMASGAAFTTVGNFITADLTQASVGTCTGTVGCTPTYSTGTYMNQLFTATTNGVPTPSGTAQNVTTGSGTTPFVINAQSNGKDTSYSANTPATTVVDLGTCSGVVANLATCGLFNIADVYTMIQANVEAFGFQGVTITLNGTSANGLASITDTINLTAGIDYRGSSNSATTNSGGVICTDANSTGQSCAGQTSDTASTYGTDNSPGGTAGNKVVTYNNVFGADTNGTTNYYLDVQELELPTSGANSFVGAYLNSVTIASASGERILFSGLTLQTASTATPEPSTVAMLAGGIALLGLLKFRRSRSAA